jgi:hypothetical protein
MPVPLYFRPFIFKLTLTVPAAGNESSENTTEGK